MSIHEELWQHVSAKGLLVALVVGFLLLKAAQRIQENLRMRRVGGARAPRVKTRLPFGA
jgi:hypothetical protein